MATLPRLTLVLGGAASGKSAFAESLVLYSGRTPVYLATAQVFDAEMRAKVALHKEQRGPGWRTCEAPFAPGEVLGDLGARDVALLDCATMWLSNHLLAENDLFIAETALMAGLDATGAPVVIVSNEVGLSVVPENALARRFRDAQGGLNQRLAARADLVVNVIAGLPLVLKGHLP